MKFRLLMRLVGVFFLSILLWGCGSDYIGDLESYVSEVKSRPPRSIEPIPLIKPYVRFLYPDHDLDPFDSSVLIAAKKVEKKKVVSSIVLDENRKSEFLEKFPLNSLNMVGTVYKENQLWGLIRVPDGAIYRVKAGNYMGKNHGRIVKVSEAFIQLTEVIEDGFDGLKERSNKMVITSPNS